MKRRGIQRNDGASNYVTNLRSAIHQRQSLPAREGEGSPCAALWRSARATQASACHHSPRQRAPLPLLMAGLKHRVGPQFLDDANCNKVVFGTTTTCARAFNGSPEPPPMPHTAPVGTQVDETEELATSPASGDAGVCHRKGGTQPWADGGLDVGDGH